MRRRVGLLLRFLARTVHERLSVLFQPLFTPPSASILVFDRAIAVMSCAHALCIGESFVTPPLCCPFPPSHQLANRYSRELAAMGLAFSRERL